MTQQEILAFINKTRIAFLATLDGNVPRVRAVMILQADETGILFNTGKLKDLHQQLSANPAVELCFYDHEEKRQLRVSGTVALKEEQATYQLVLEQLPFLRPLVAAQGYELLAPYVLTHGRATFWSMATNLEPKTYCEF